MTFELFILGNPSWRKMDVGGVANSMVSKGPWSGPSLSCAAGLSYRQDLWTRALQVSVPLLVFGQLFKSPNSTHFSAGQSPLTFQDLVQAPPLLTALSRSPPLFRPARLPALLYPTVGSFSIGHAFPVICLPVPSYSAFVVITFAGPGTQQILNT